MNSRLSFHFRTRYINRSKEGLWIILVLSGIIVAGCANSSNDTRIDRSFLTGKPCEAPCWYGLELDKANEDDVRQTLKTLPFIDQTTMREWTAPWLGDWSAKEIHPNCVYPVPATTGCVGLLIYNDKLKQIRMSIAYELTFGTVVEKLGPPDYMSYDIYHPEVGGCVIDLGWTTKGIDVEYLDTRDESKCKSIKKGNGVDRSTIVSGLFYYSVKEGFKSTEGLFPWTGFTSP